SGGRPPGRGRQRRPHRQPGTLRSRLLGDRQDVVDLRFTDAEEGFRAEAREWLAVNVPHGLPSGDTREGFALHLDWERKLFDARWAVVSWPEAYGGREASLIGWLIFEEEYYRAGGPQRITQNGI